MATPSPLVFTKIKHSRKSFLDLPKVVREMVYEKYFGSSKKVVQLVVIHPTTGFRSLHASGRRLLSKDQALARRSGYSAHLRTEDRQTVLVASSVISVNKAVHGEALESLYQHSVIGVCDHPAHPTPSLRALPSLVLSKIVHLHLNVNFLGYELSRLTYMTTRNCYGAQVTLNDWNVVIKQMPSLKTLEVHCASVLELRNLAMRLVTNTNFLSAETQVFFRMIPTGPENTRTEIVPISDEDHLEGNVKNPKAFTVPAVQTLIFKSRMAPAEFKELQDMTWNGYKFTKLGEEAIEFEWQSDDPYGYQDEDGSVTYSTFQDDDVAWPTDDEPAIEYTYRVEGPVKDTTDPAGLSTGTLASIHTAVEDHVGTTAKGNAKDFDWAKSLRGKFARFALD